MKKKNIHYLVFVLLLISIGLTAQSKKTKDRNAIKSMCGCFEVTFNFTETFNYSKDSLYLPSKDKVASGLEWAQLIENKKNKISIQHLLQVGSPAHPHIVKHWRQDWLYQNTNFYMYNGDNNWTYEKKEKLDVKKQWTQKVYQVDDSPRYEGSATWVHVDGKSYWENTTAAPLPRREYTKRNDYNITLRRNRHEITTDGWLHNQDNDKIIRKTTKKDIVLAKEKGFNVYKKVADNKCQSAIDWWKKNNPKWTTVRNVWQQVYNQNRNLILKSKVDNKPLYKYLFGEGYTTKSEISKIIEAYIIK